MLKLRARNRADSEVLSDAISRAVVLNEWHSTRPRFELFLTSVLAGQLPDYLQTQFATVLDVHEAVEAWRLGNIENLALVAENVSLAAANENRLRATDLWDVCSDVRWIESTLIDDLRTHLP